MTTKKQANPPDDQVGCETDKVEASTRLLRAEIERLHQQLEDERARDRQTIASLQAERDAYRSAVYAWALDQIKEEDLERYAQHEEGFPLDDVIQELDNHAKVTRGA